MKNNFAYFIASYNKPDFIPTYEELKARNASYPIFIVVGMDDPSVDEYLRIYKDKCLIFEKEDYIPNVDSLGWYAKTHKVCTYSRLAINNFAKELGYEYICYLFDDIDGIRLRGEVDGKIQGTDDFCIDTLMDIYIDFLKCSDDLYITGPPNSSFYIGINKDRTEEYSTRFGNMFVYKVDSDLYHYSASVLEDMSIILFNNMVGKMSICPFGVHVNCRAPKITKDCYGDMSAEEWLQQSVLITNTPVSVERPIIPYSKFTPKIIDEKYRKEKVL